MSATTQAVILGRQDVQVPRPGPLAFVPRHRLAVFLALVFALTWALEIPWIESTEGPVKFDFPFPLFVVMGWMPRLAAILTTGAISGRAGIEGPPGPTAHMAAGPEVVPGADSWVGRALDSRPGARIR
jgi:hypothetical protein